MSATAEQGTNTLSIIVWSSLVPPIPLLLLALLLDTPTTLFQALTSLDELSIFSVFFIAFGATLFGFGTWSELLSKYSSSVVAPLSLLVPITGLLTARIVLNEHMALSQWIGCCVIILGLVLTTVGFDRLRAWFSPI